MNNAVFPDRLKDILRAGRESYGHTVQSVAARSILHKFLKRWKSTNEFIVSFTSTFGQLKIYTEIKKKTNWKKPSLKTVNHHREGIYTSFKLESSAFTEVIQLIDKLT